MSFILRNESNKLLPTFGEDRACALAVFIKPSRLMFAAEIDPTEYQTGHSFRMRLGVSKCQRAAPGAAKYQPALDAEVLLLKKGVDVGVAPTPIGPSGKRASMYNGLADSVWVGTDRLGER